MVVPEKYWDLSSNLERHDTQKERFEESMYCSLEQLCMEGMESMEATSRMHKGGAPNTISKHSWTAALPAAEGIAWMV